MWDVPIFPEQASTIAGQVDMLYFVLTALAAFFAFGVAATLIFFAVRYRHRNERPDRSNPVSDNLLVETTWIVIPTGLALAVFTWGAVLFFEIKQPPEEEPMEVYAIAKQWMWKFQHPNGVREINNLHVPVGRPVKMIMTSQDVIHSFFVPVFRVKQDVLPGLYTDAWFEATKPGTYHLFCTEFCGTSHSDMIGQVTVMKPEAYEAWLRLGTTDGSNTEPGTGRFERTPSGAQEPTLDPGPWGGSLPEQENVAPTESGGMAASGARLFETLRCASCHRADSTALYPAQGPALYGLYGSDVQLQNNRTVTADEQYLRESILYPQAKLVAGYPPIMPTYKGQLQEEELFALIQYLKSLRGAEMARPDAAPSDTTAANPPAPVPTDTTDS